MQRRYTLQEVQDWRQAAIDAGWAKSPIYDGEDIERAMYLRKGGEDGWLAHTIARPGEDGLPDMTSLAVYAPLGEPMARGVLVKLGVLVPVPFCEAKLEENTTRCQQCGVADETVGYSPYAGRTCRQHRSAWPLDNS